MSVPVAEMPLTEIIKILPGYDPYDDCVGYYFDEAKAVAAIKWIERFCTLTKGKQFAGKPFLLELWQKAVVANAFGWIAEDDGSRRYREVLVYVPRKNGKTELMAAMNLLIMFCDQEEGAEIYSAASTEDQAKIVWDVSKKMIKNKQLLTDNCKVYQKSITHDLTNSFYKPTVANADSTHGYNAHSVTVDELHACLQKVVEVLETSQGSRFQPFFWYTTTADFDRPSICNKVHARAKKIMKGDVKDPNFLPVVYEAEKDDDWHDEKVWRKANPNYGVSLNVKEFKRAYAKACSEKSYENTFKRLRLNMKTEQSERWIQLLLWDKCNGQDKLGEHRFRGHPDDLESLSGRPCYAGLDLSSTIDTSSLVLVFPEDDFKIISYFWIPEDTAEEKEKIDAVPYSEWSDEGWLVMTPGCRIDYDFIRQQIIDICEVVDMKQLGFDPYNATQLSIQLTENDGIPMKMVRQGYVTMNEPCKRIEADMAKGIMCHGGNPILRSHASNVMIRKDPTGSIKIDKEKSSEKVDGMAALADAYACYIAEIDDESPYNHHGILSLGGDDDDSDVW